MSDNINIELSDNDDLTLTIQGVGGGSGGPAVWGQITGNLGNQADLAAALAAKADASDLPDAISDYVTAHRDELKGDTGETGPQGPEGPQGTAGPSVWGGISGILANQTDLQTALNAKANDNDLATVAKTGSYNDLSDKPVIPSLSGYATEAWVEAKGYLTATALADYVQTSDLSTAIDGVKTWVQNQNYLTEHQSLSAYATQAWVNQQGFLKDHQSLAGYATQDWVEAKRYITLDDVPPLPGIKTINGQSLIGSGNIEISGGGVSEAQLRRVEYKPVLIGQYNPFGTYGSVYDIKIDGDYAYAVNSRTTNGFVKWLIGGTSTAKKLSITPTGAHATDLPADMSAFYKSGSSFIARSIALGKNHIYVGIRYSGGVSADGTHLYGGIVVIRKSDCTVVKSYWTLGMSSRVVLSPDGTLLAVGNQMRGITFYSIAADGYTLTQVYQHIYDQSTGSATKTCESQAGCFYNDGTHLYYLNAGFAKGFVLYDCTDSSNITYVGQINFSDFAAGTLAGHCHTYTAHVEYPYAYVTIATDKDEIVVGGTNYCGVAVLDLTDPTNVVMTDYKTIDNADVVAWTEFGDSKPTEMRKCGNHALVLNYEDGILIFEIAADGAHVNYCGKYYDHLATYGIDTNGLVTVTGDANGSTTSGRMYLLYGI